MHSAITMEHIAILNGYARPICVCSTEVWNLLWYAFLARSEGRRYRSNSKDFRYQPEIWFTMKRITVWHSHTQLMFASSDPSWPRVLPFSERFFVFIIVSLHYINFTLSFSLKSYYSETTVYTYFVPLYSIDVIFTLSAQQWCNSLGLNNSLPAY